MMNVNPAKGTRDILPAEVAKRRQILDIIRAGITARGFMEIETPSIETIGNLKSKQGGENESMLFEIQRRGLPKDTPISPSEATDLGLRYDLTLPLSRYYANNAANLPNVFRAFQTGSVWRAEKPQKGRYRQFQQCDMDIIGADGKEPEIEILTTGWAVLRQLGIAEKCNILINDRRLLDWLLNASEVVEEKRPSVLISLDKLDKIGADGVIRELENKVQLPNTTATKLLSAITTLENTELAGDTNEIKIADFATPVPLFELTAIIQTVKTMAPDASITFTPSLVRGMGYYTGTIFEVKHSDTGSSICGGGRYDEMIGKMLRKTVPAVGFSFGFERLTELINFADIQQPTALALAYSNAEQYIQALKLREKLKDTYKTIGLSKTPRRVKATYFDALVEQGYTAVILPSELELPATQAIASAKNLIK